MPQARQKIAVRNVSRMFGDAYAVKDISFEVMEGETLVLIGTSGCGKTTTMKMINRLVEPTGGTIEIDGRNVREFDVIGLRRGIGYVIQSVGLFPHLTIGRNVSVVPELLHWPREKVLSRVDELLSMVGLEPDLYRDRFPAELSGGQQQRVGVARALAADPPVILMDEPFGALDPITREQLQDEFLSLVRRIGKTILFVTHDIFEAARIGDRLAVMDQGRIIQCGTPREIVERPAGGFVRNFLGGHRFQLSLLLTHLGEVMTTEPAEEIAGDGSDGRPDHLRADSTLLDALNYFKENGSDAIPIRNHNGKRIGFVRRKAVCDWIRPA